MSYWTPQIKTSPESSFFSIWERLRGHANHFVSRSPVFAGAQAGGVLVCQLHSQLHSQLHGFYGTSQSQLHSQLKSDAQPAARFRLFFYKTSTSQLCGQQCYIQLWLAMTILFVRCDEMLGFSTCEGSFSAVNLPTSFSPQ